jgi:hypothetical protein
LSDEGMPKILTNGVYENIIAKFYKKDYVSAVLAGISNKAKLEIFQVYLCGNFGKKLPQTDVKAEILKTFLVFEGIGENAEMFFGFPDLSENIAEIFSENSVLQKKEIGSPMLFYGTFLNDFVIILDMFKRDECKICTNGVFSQKWTELLKERCGIGKLLNNHEYLLKILNFVIEFSQSCGAKFLTENGKVLLLADTGELIGKITNKISGNFSKIINDFMKTIDFHFLRELVSDSEYPVNFNSDAVSGIIADINFSLKIFHWCGFSALNENSFKIKENKLLNFQNGHILPDFNIYIPIETDPLQLNKILLSVKITAVDVIYRGKIDRKRIEEALVRGAVEKEIMETLQNWNAPLSLQKTISEWIYSFQRAFEDLPYIAFRNDIAGNIAEYSDLKGKLLPFEGYTFFRVKEGEEKSVFQTLEKFGFDLRKNREKNLIPLEEIGEVDDNPPEFNRKPHIPTKTLDYIFVRND